MQNDLVGSLSNHNNGRAHHGRGIEGTTPFNAFLEELPKDEQKAKKMTEKAA